MSGKKKTSNKKYDPATPPVYEDCSAEELEEMVDQLRDKAGRRKYNSAISIYEDYSVKELEEMIEKLLPLHRPLNPPKFGDWRYHYKEPTQTFADYLGQKARMPRGKHRIIYIQPLGNFSPKEREIITLTAEFMIHYFGLEVHIQPDMPLSIIPASAQRIHPEWQVKQILSGYVLREILLKRRPKKAAAYIALTNVDLWPGKGWNFVFGQASFNQRVGVWSIYRNGNPHRDDTSFRECLVRTIKTATHEIGHIFSMSHCTLYECNMCGANSQEEADRYPLALCPECLAKLCWAMNINPIERFHKLAEFCNKNSLKKEEQFYRTSIRVLDAE
ncbi:MAG: archaemetzincin [Candidatus Hermodarchaeota archaeon]